MSFLRRSWHWRLGGDFCLSVFGFDYRSPVLEQKCARRHESIEVIDESQAPCWHALHGNALLKSILAYTGTGHRVRRCRALGTSGATTGSPHPVRQLISCLDALDVTFFWWASTRARDIDDLPTKSQAHEQAPRR